MKTTSESHLERAILSTFKRMGVVIMPKVASMEQKQRFIELRAKGMPFERISNEIGISKPTLIEWAKEQKIEIANLKALEIEALQEQYFMSWKKRVELLNNQLERINLELDNRDLADVPTEKLVDMQSKLLDKLKQEYIEIKVKEEQTTEESLEESLFGKQVKEWTPE